MADWYPIKVLRSAPPKSATDELPYQTHLDGVNGAFKACGLKTRHKTHCGRGSGAIMADLAGAPENDIRRAGRWNMQVIDKSYLTTLPRSVMRAHAGFPGKPGRFRLARDVPPPSSLVDQIFPDTLEW